MLVRLIYCSTLAENSDTKELNKIVELAKSHNTKEFITGLLVFGNDYFLQCIEGNSEAINKLYHKIIADQRHHHPLLLEYQEVDERLFEDWAMKLILLTPKKIKTLIRFSSVATFNPYVLSGSSALKMMTFLKNQPEK